MKKIYISILIISGAGLLVARDLVQAKSSAKNTITDALSQPETAHAAPNGLMRNEELADSAPHADLEIVPADEQAHDGIESNVQESADNHAALEDQESDAAHALLAAVQPPQEFIIDSIKAVIYSPYGTQLITLSDIERPNIAGQMRSLDDIIFERLIVLDAAKHKLPMDEEAVDKYLAQIQRENNLTNEQLQEVFAAAGYSFKEGREQFGVMQTVNAMLNMKVYSGLIVPRKDVEAYYDAHPAYTPERYLIQYALVPFEDDHAQQKTRLQRYAQTAKGMTISWSEPFWIEKDDLAESKQFITAMPVETIAQPYQAENGFELYRVKDKQEARLLTLEERYREISNVLRQPRAQQLLTDYRQELMASASIVYR